MPADHKRTTQQLHSKSDHSERPSSMETVKNLVAGASETVASAAQSAKESLTGVQEKVRAVQQHGIRELPCQAVCHTVCMRLSALLLTN
jgi:hypothetical protein